MSFLREQIIEKHINDNYPNSKIQSYLDKDNGLSFFTVEELQNFDGDWFPLCCYKNENGQAVYGGRSRIIHTYTEGETGAGKTTRFVMQAIKALSSMKVKPSFVIVDIHGEIIENLYKHFKDNQYDIKILNCDNPQRSDTYNPFSELAKECLRTQSISNDAVNKIRKISEIIQPIESNQDPIWDRGARSYTNGCILDKFEDLINGDIPENCLTIYNVIQNHYWLRKELANSYGNDLFRIPHYKRKGTNALSTQKMISVTNNADKTRASYFGVVENHYDTFGQPSLYSLSSSNNIDIKDFINKPTAIVIQSGNTKIGNDLISLLVNEIYSTIVTIGKESARKKLSRKVHCFLDEFANCNIADGPEYIKMLTTSRKFGLYWHMILQCDAQLDRKFDPDIGRIIRANCTEIFMGSHDYETEIRFAKSCGQKTIESLGSKISQQTPNLEVVDLMTPEKLNLTEVGHIYVKSNRHPLLESYFEAFYNCEEFENVDNIDSIYPHNKFDYTNTAFYPNDIPPYITSKEYEVLRFIYLKRRTFTEIVEHFKKYDVNGILNNLSQKKVIVLLENQVVKSNVLSQEMQLYEYRYKHDAICIASMDFSKRHMPKLGNPFDFEYMPNASEVSNALLNDKEIDFEEWLKNAQQQRQTKTLFDEMQEHIRQNRDRISETVFEHLTLVPVLLMDVVKAFLKGESTLNCVEPEMINKSARVLKFEIIEAYICNNYFDTKSDWEEQMKKEYMELSASNVFPKSVLDVFEQALNDITVELTLSNIREIKRIISGNLF